MLPSVVDKLLRGVVLSQSNFHLVVHDFSCNANKLEFELRFSIPADT